MQRLQVLLVLLALVFVTGRARAQMTPEVEKLKTSADTAMDNLRYAEALEGYQKAYGISHDPRFLYNMGRALGALGEYPEAVEKLERFQIDAPPDLKGRVAQLDQLIADFRKHVSSLTITSNVPGARVLVRAKAVGQTPINELKLNAGPAVVEIAADDYAPQRKDVVLPEGSSLTVSFDLVKASPLGVLFLRSTPPATTVTVDGRGLGGTPLETSLMPGQHSLLLSRDGYRDLSTTAVIERGRRHELDLKLEKTPSVFSRWWFWTIVGVVVVGAAAATTVAVICSQGTNCERSADMGTIPPFQVRGP
jgi:hypothetical protein